MKTSNAGEQLEECQNHSQRKWRWHFQNATSFNLHFFEEKTKKTDTGNNFPYFNRVLNFCGTIMVQFKANYRKTKQSILVKIT